MATQAERTASTVAALKEAARTLFGERGFDATPVGDIIAAAGVAKGAFYHHFSSKEEIFRAVLEETQQELATRLLTAAATGGDALDRVKRGCRAFLNACVDPAVQRIVLRDGPAVVGWEAWRAIDAKYFGALLRQGLEQAMDAGLLARRPIAPLEQLLLGAVTEAAMVCARSSTPKRDVRELMLGLDALLEGLR